VLAERALVASWKMGDGCLLRIYINLSIMPVPVTPSWSNGRLLFSHQVLKAEYDQGILTPGSILVCIAEDAKVTIEESHLQSIEEPKFVLVEETT
jgi:hypothetical protein